jgi:reactive intermediate/imine deaminase
VPISAAVKANGFVFISGAPPIDPDTGKLVTGNIEEQTEAVLRYLGKVLTASGSSFDKVVKVTVFAANSAYFARINEIYRRYFPHQPPARTFVTVGSWPMEFDIEIECVALVD